jgi:hypothetical protein
MKSKRTELKSAAIHERTPIEFPGGEAFRESYVLWMPSRDVRLFRELFSRVFDCYCEANQLASPAYAGSVLRGELRAAAKDLRFLAAFLAEAAHTRIDEAPNPTEEALALLADDLAVQLDGMADLIDSRVLPKRRASARSEAGADAGEPTPRPR